MNQLREVMRLDGVTAKWHDLGLELKVINNDLREIEVDHQHNVNTCCRMMFQKWLEGTPDASWEQLVSALSNIGLNTAANAIRTQYNTI